MRAEVRLELPRAGTTVPVARRLVECLTSAAGAPRHVVADLAVAVSEACTNAVEHARGDRYEVELRIDDAVCEIEIVDQGIGIDAAHVDMPDPIAREGRGIPLMEALIDNVTVRSLSQGGTSVTLRHGLRQPHQSSQHAGSRHDRPADLTRAMGPLSREDSRR